MTISGQPPVSLLDSTLQAQNTNQAVGVTMLKKAQDTMKQEGQAMISMLEESGANPGPQGQHLDAYA